jgi:type II secretory ATPase GspE/PulE/Tfp pilus assembly ATPase PilB-like protein
VNTFAAVPPALIPQTLGLEGFFLVSWWKPLLFLIPIGVWAWVISSIYDKHAARFHLPRQQWNLAHLIVGLIAVLVPLVFPPVAGPWTIFIAMTIVLVILGSDLLAYMMIANKDDRVPEQHHVKIDLSRFKERRLARKVSKVQATVSLQIKGPNKQEIPPPQKETPEYEIRANAEELYLAALATRASRIEIVPTGKDGGYVLLAVVDGVRQQVRSLAGPEATKVIDFWKTCAGLDASDRRRMLQAEIHIGKGTDVHQARLTTSGTSAGMRLSLLIDPEVAVDRKPEDLGLLDQQMLELREIVSDETGVVLLASGAQQGRTTTLYTVLRMHDAYTSNVQTVEVDPQMGLEGVRHNKFDATSDGPEYATLTRSILRRDPDVLGIAELPDAATAKECARSDQERTRIYLGIRADNALAAVQQWAKAVGDLDSAGGALRGVVCQRLLRKLCSNCRVAYTPAPDTLKKLNLPAEVVKQLYKKGGQVILKNKNQPETCPICQGTGYLGQTGVFEVFGVGPDERALLKEGNLAGVRASWRKRKLPTIQQAALRKAVEGVTSIEEVLRVTAEQAPKSKAQPSDAA